MVVTLSPQGTKGDEPTAEDPRAYVYWLSLDDYRPNPPLAGDLHADVALVGGGFTSLWTAYLLLKRDPGLKVALLEAQTIGYGASGRNGGFAMTLVHRTLSHMAAYLGDREAKKVYLAAKRAVEHITETITAEGLGCDPQPNGLITLSNTVAQDRIVHDEMRTAQRLGVGHDFEWLDAKGARDRIHSPRIRYAVRERACTLLNPARLARELKRVVEALGCAVYEHTPVESWEETVTGVELHTPAGTVAVDRVVLGGNAYAAHWPATRKYLLPFYSYICLTRPLSAAEWESVGWDGREGAEDRRVGLHYFRPTIDGRILWGGRDPAYHPDGPAAHYDREEWIFRRMRTSFEWFFPQLAAVPFEYRWGGPIAVTGNFLPIVGCLDGRERRVLAACGYNGHGVAITNLAAHAVADLLADKRSEWTDLAFVGAKPLDLGPRWLRDPLVRATVKAQIRADDEAREAKDPFVLRVLNRITGADLHNV